MIVEERIYELLPGHGAEYQRRIESEGIAIQRPILGRLVGYFASDIGELNQVVHLWAFDSLEDRAERRARLLADPHWREFVATVQPLIVRMENSILIPMAFSPIPPPWHGAA